MPGRVVAKRYEQQVPVLLEVTTGSSAWGARLIVINCIKQWLHIHSQLLQLCLESAGHQAD